MLSGSFAPDEEHKYSKRTGRCSELFKLQHQPMNCMAGGGLQKRYPCSTSHPIERHEVLDLLSRLDRFH